MLVRFGPARGRVDRALHQSLLAKNPRHRRDVCNRHEERGHPPFLYDPANRVARGVQAPRALLLRTRGPRKASAENPASAAHGVRGSPVEPLLDEIRVEGGPVIRVDLGPVTLAKGSGDKADLAAAAAASHPGNLTTRGGPAHARMRRRTRGLPTFMLEPANAAEKSDDSRKTAEAAKQQAGAARRRRRRRRWSGSWKRLIRWSTTRRKTNNNG